MEYRECGKCGKSKPLTEYKRITDSWCKECTNRYTDEYAKLHKEEKKEYDKIYHLANFEKRNKTSREWRGNFTGQSEPRKKYETTREAKDARNKSLSEKRKNDVGFRLNSNISTAVYASLKGNKKGAHWEDLVGYTVEDLKKHLESLFQPGMTWENWGKGEGKWHIDHIIPMSLFNISSVKSKGFKMCWALENLRPMWGTENIRKGNKLFY